MKLAHVINPVKVDEDRDLYWQQPIVFETINTAYYFACNKPDLEVDVFTVGYPEDADVCREFIKLPDLTRSSSDLNYSPERKLPYFKDILDSVYNATDADYIIQTNADICVQPYFYTLIHSLIQEGHESFVISKRILPEIDLFKTTAGIPIMYSGIGKPHNGHDCFVFPRKDYKRFKIGDILTGTPWSEATIMFNMIAVCDNFAEFMNAHATFHIGDRRIWLPKSHNDYRIHNTNIVGKVLRTLVRRKNGNKLYKHDTIRKYIGKIQAEVLGYKDKRYNTDCKYFAKRGNK